MAEFKIEKKSVETNVEKKEVKVIKKEVPPMLDEHGQYSTLDALKVFATTQRGLLIEHCISLIKRHVPDELITEHVVKWVNIQFDMAVDRALHECQQDAKARLSSIVSSDIRSLSESERKMVIEFLSSPDIDSGDEIEILPPAIEDLIQSIVERMTSVSKQLIETLGVLSYRLYV